MDYQTATQHRRDCKTCGYANGRAQIEEGPFGPHFARAVCHACGAHWDWVTKPDADKFRRPASHRRLVEKYGRGFCELCLKRQDDMHAGHSLVGHHLIEFQDGGDDSRENTWILCTGCHRLVHWVRTYLTGRSEPADMAESEDATERS